MHVAAECLNLCKGTFISEQSEVMELPNSGSEPFTELGVSQSQGALVDWSLVIEGELGETQREASRRAIHSL